MSFNNSSKAHMLGPEHCVCACAKFPLWPIFHLFYSSIKSNCAISLIFQPNRSEGSHQSPSAEDKSNRTRGGKARTRTRSDRGRQSHTKTSARTKLGSDVAVAS